MADYLSFSDGVLILDPVPSDSDEELNISGINLDEEEPEVRFNDPNADLEVLATVSLTDPNSSRKRTWDDVEHEEELIEGSGLFAK